MRSSRGGIFSLFALGPSLTTTVVVEGPLAFNRLLELAGLSDGEGDESRSELFLLPSDARVAEGMASWKSELGIG